MHALKVSWGGQTFALAKCNDSQGRKSRIRRSKEERKTMVESFINDYRTSNNGKFPSLNLTHKEVGGSFYTVREIVREIIQENKVLGPATVSSEERRADHFSDQYASNSLSVEPHSHLSLSEIGHAIDQGQKDILSFTNDVQSVCEDFTFSSGQSISGCYEMVESEDRETNIPHFVHEAQEVAHQQQNLYDGIGRYVNGNPMGKECRDEEAMELLEPGKIRTQADETSHSEVHANKKLDDEIGKQNDSMETSAGSTTDGGMVSESMESYIISEAKVVINVETNSISLPIQDQPSATISNCSLIEGSEAAMTGTLQSKETNLSTETVELSSGLPTSDTIPTGDTSSHAVDERTEREIETAFSASKSTPTNDYSTHKRSYLSNGTGLESSVSHDDELNLETYDQKHLVTGTELKKPSAPNDSQIEEVASVATIDSIHGESFSSVMDQISRSPEKATEEPSKAGETNPIWVAIRAFLTAFVKFWVE